MPISSQYLVDQARTKSMPSKHSPFQALLDERIRRIDVHHHYFTPELDKEKSNAAVGWRTPKGHLPWSAEVSLQAMQAMNIDFAVLSFPALSSGSVSEQNREIVRKRNEYVAGVCQNHPRKFAFLATLPFLDDIEGVYCLKFTTTLSLTLYS